MALATAIVNKDLNSLNDSLQLVFQQRALPNTDYKPPGFRKYTRLATIPSLIILDLLSPPFGVCLWQLEVFRTSVPKASIYHDTQVGTPKDNVSTTRNPVHWSHVDSKAQAAAV